MATDYESGIRPNRIEFVREAEEAVTPTDPAWLPFSNNVRTNEPTMAAQTEAQRGLGDHDPIDFRNSVEAHQLTIAYDLQQSPVDGSNNPLDASYDALSRTAGNNIPNSHTVVRRMDKYDLEPGNTVEGSGGAAKDTREYYVGKGGKANLTITGDPTTPQPDLFELAYEFEKGRLYQIDQPSNEALTVVNDSSEEITIDIENEGASKSEQVVVAAGSSTTTTESAWEDIDAAELTSTTTGNVRIQDSNGEDLMIIYGGDSYEHGEGDLGVPILGAGSHASSITSGYSVYQSGSRLRAGNEVADNIVSAEGTIENGYDPRARDEGPRRAIIPGNRTSTLALTVYGEAEHYQHARRMLQSNDANLTWDYVDDAGNDIFTLRWDAAANMEVEGTEETGQGVKEVSVTIEGQGVTINP